MEPGLDQIRRPTIPNNEPVSEGEDRSKAFSGKSFWQERSIEELAREQGVRPVERLEDVLGRHADLWESDEEFEQFLRDIYERRRDNERRA